MQFVNAETSLDQEVITRILLPKFNGGDAALWLSTDAVTVSEDGNLQLRLSDDGVFAQYRVQLDDCTPLLLTQASALAYQTVLSALRQRPNVHIARVWNVLPNSTQAFSAFYQGRAQAWPAHSDSVFPATSTVQDSGMQLTVAMFASYTPPVCLENLRREPPAWHSQRTQLEPSSRGVVLDIAGQRLLLTAGTNGLPEVGPAGDLYEQFMLAVDRLRNLVSQFNLKNYGLDIGFGLEDLQSLTVDYQDAEDGAELQHLISRQLGFKGALVLRQQQFAQDSQKLLLAGVLVKKGEALKVGEKKYQPQADGRLRVECFELHVTEHCNLRCQACCNMSPYLDHRELSVEQVLAECRQMAQYLVADTFKIMGGEPLMHPQIDAILSGLKSTGISPVIRLFTNGLLLSKMSDAFWQALDHLTISNYSSAPIRPAVLAGIQQKARQFNVALNIKEVDRFNAVMKATATTDATAIQQTYDDCWLRHRCLIVRDGVFYKCTRAAYQVEFAQRTEVVMPQGYSATAAKAADGVALSGSDLPQRLADYLNSPTPLNACSTCHGGSGPLMPHRQLSKAAISQGLL